MKPTRTLNTMNWKFIAFGFLASGWILSGCTPERSGATGWAYNDTANGGFERRPYGGKKQPQDLSLSKAEHSRWVKSKTT